MRNATRAMVSTLGVIMGLGGIEHGIGEVLQGNTVPSGVVFPSWPDSAFFRVVAGEPAMSIIPNFLVTGILAILFSLVFTVWVTMFIHRRNGGLFLILLSIIMLLVGGGIFPPIIGIMIGILGTRINTPLTWWRVHLPINLRQFLRKLWLWSFTVCIIAWLLLFPGMSIMDYFFGVNDPNLTYITILCAFGFLLLTIFTGFVKDAQQQTELH
ncbi:MAG: hypothetical protein PHU08_03005 [Dehalococcoidales bacterium]|nr:hypothetical protein [Dehalococcoidales bacterium]